MDSDKRFSRFRLIHVSRHSLNNHNFFFNIKMINYTILFDILGFSFVIYSLLRYGFSDVYTETLDAEAATELLRPAT